MPTDCDMSVPSASGSDHGPLRVTIVLSVCLHVAVLAAAFRMDLPWSGGDVRHRAGVLDVTLDGQGEAVATETSSIPADLTERALPTAAPPEPVSPAVPPPSPGPEIARFYPTTFASSETRIALAGLGPTEDHLPALDSVHWEPELVVEMADAEQRMLEQHLETWLADPVQLVSNDSHHWEFDGVLYEAAALALPAQSSTDLDRTLIEVRKYHGGRWLSTRMQLRRLAFSHYAHFINNWDPDVYLSRDTIEGRFHSNSAVNIDTSARVRPQFAGPVSIAAVQRQSNMLQRSGMFKAGLQTMVDRIPLSAETHPAPVSELEDSAKIVRFSTDTSIRFHGNGSYTWWPSANRADAVHETVLDTGTLILIADEGVALSVQGEVAGRVLVYSPRMIRITGDLVYANDPLRDEASGDWLSLISDHTIQIAEASVTGPGDLSIHGALYAGNRFSVRGFRSGNNTAVLSITGSLVAGSVSATEPRYATRVVYDPRLDTHRAPGFPMTGRYALESRDEHWALATAR